MNTRWITMCLLCFLLVLTPGCFLTKIVTVPMRIGAAGVSIVPVAGNPAHDAVDKSAAGIDKLPF